MDPGCDSLRLPDQDLPIASTYLWVLKAQERRREPILVKLGLVTTLSSLLHWAILLALLTAAPERDPVTPDLIPFRLVNLEDVATPPADASFVSQSDAQNGGVVDPENPHHSAGGQDQPTVPQLAAPDPSEPDPDGMELPVPDPPATPSSIAQPSLEPIASQTAHFPHLQQQLQQSVAAHNWDQALDITRQLMAASPTQVPELTIYQDHLQQLADRENRQPTPPYPLFPAPVTVTPLPSPPGMTPSSQPLTHLFAAPQPAAHLFASPQPVVMLTRATPLSGSGGLVSGVANPSETAAAQPNLAARRDLEWGAYVARLQSRVQKNWLIRGSNRSHTTVVLFTVERSGQLREIHLQKPSDSDLIDAAVLGAIQRSAPFEPLPIAYTGETRTFELTVLSGLREEEIQVHIQ
jgi:outer membrane biosynthesis protein TonB